jgi:hypothetical protein
MRRKFQTPTLRGVNALRIVNLPDAATHGGMRVHLLTRNRRPRALTEAISGIGLRLGPALLLDEV